MFYLCFQHVCKALQQFYRVRCSAEDVLNLDSSTNEKFSRHLIFQLHDVAFKDNIHVGKYYFFLKSHNYIKNLCFPFLLKFCICQVLWSLTCPIKMNHDFSCFQDWPLVLDLSSYSRYILDTLMYSGYPWH